MNLPDAPELCKFGKNQSNRFANPLIGVFGNPVMAHFHIAGSHRAFVYVRQSTADQLLHIIMRAAAANTDWPIARVNSAGKKPPSSTTISADRARVSAARVLSACWPRYARAGPVRCLQSRLPAWRAMGGTGIR